MKTISPLYKKNQQDIIRKRILEYKKRDDLKSISNVDDLGGEIYLLKVRTPESRVIIQEKEVNIDQEKIKVFFIRAFINDIKFDRESGRIWYGRIKRGEWLQENELIKEEVNDFKNEYIKEKSTSTKSLETPPRDLTQWLDEFKLQLNNEIFEMEEWVEYAQNNNSGMRDIYVYTFRAVLEKIVNSDNTDDFTVVKDDNLVIYQYVVGAASMWTLRRT